MNMAVPIDIAFAAKLLNLKLGLTTFAGQSAEEASYGSVLLILALITVIALLLYRSFIALLDREDTANAQMSLD